MREVDGVRQVQGGGQALAKSTRLQAGAVTRVGGDSVSIDTGAARHPCRLGRTGQPGSTTLSSTNNPRCQSGTQEAAQLPRRPPVAAVLLPHLLHHGVHLCRRQVGVPHWDGLPPGHGAGCFSRVGGKYSRCIVLVAWWRWGGGVGGLELIN